LPKAVTLAPGGQSVLDLIEPEDAGEHNLGGLKRQAQIALDADGPVGAQQQFQIVKVVHGAARIYQES
jgi:hypothetical protein